jgi:hypothetical protein
VLGLDPAGGRRRDHVRRNDVQGAFNVQKPGTYVISGAYPPGQQGARAVHAVGKGIVTGMLFSMFAGFGLDGVCFLAALILEVVMLPCLVSWWFSLPRADAGRP